MTLLIILPGGPNISPGEIFNSTVQLTQQVDTDVQMTQQEDNDVQMTQTIISEVER